MFTGHTMSTLSENLDIFDCSVFDPMAQLPGREPTFTNLSVSLTPKTVEDNVEEEEVEGVEHAASDKADILDTFTVDLWSEESSTSRTLDSWDLPVGPVAWDDNDKPIERLLNYADLTLTKEEENGLLTDRIVAACSSYLTESPGNRCHIVAKVSLNNKNLNDIRILGYHRFLRYVDLSWNNLTDLTPLGCIPYLMYLDVSHNLMEEVLRFKPPMNLTYVNYSYNEVWQIDDLTDFWALVYLDLSHNKISKIQGFDELKYLRYLDLSHNKIERLENLNNLRITDLNLEYNLVSRFEMEQGLGVKTLPHLSNLHLNNNLITSLEFLEGVYTLKKLELQGNNISDLMDLENLKAAKILRQLDMSGNPVSELKPYRQLLLSFLPELKFLDGMEVDVSERVAACKKHRFDVQLEAARNHARMILLEQLNDTSLDLDVFPVDQASHPFVILVGPSASSKKYIVGALGEKYPEKIHIGRLHTTREVLESEKTVLIHTSREDFNENIKSGKFLCVTENLGQLYGFSREELGMAVKEHKLCLTSMDMVAALTIHSYGIQPYLILAIPQSKEEHTKRLKITYGPVLSMLGAAYIAQRQLIDTHESNVKRVETIICGLLHNVMQIVTMRSMYVYGESPEGHPEYSSFSKMFDGKFPSSCFLSEDEQSSQENPETDRKELICYQSHSDCYACTQSVCGFQSSRKSPVQDTGSSLSIDEQRSSASEVQMKAETSATSYSAADAPPLKVDYSSGEVSSCGEPFADWSMPFIDWSEVNLSSLQLEQAAELLCQKYIENVMSTRDVYLNLHLDNPGLFTLCVFTDDAKQAMKEITKVMKEVWRSTPYRRPPFDVEKDLVYQAFVPRKLEKLKEMLWKDFLSADGDGAPKALNVAPTNSPASVCADMRAKGYGDSASNL